MQASLNYEPLLQPFLEHSVEIRSIVAYLDEDPLDASALHGDDLLVLTADQLAAHMPPVEREFSFRAVAVFLTERENWRLRRSLFDRGLVCIGQVCIGDASIGGRRALCFLASDAVRCLASLDIESRG